MPDRNAFFEDLANAMDSWVKESVDAVVNEKADLLWTDREDCFKRLQEIFSENDAEKTDVEQVFSECFRGLAVSFLTILDGGTALADTGRLYLVDEEGRSLGEGLHDDFVTYLLETGRLE